ncbi:MAG: hypothetical protein D6722_24765, partial [Bacteroidetes bacterium]
MIRLLFPIFLLGGGLLAQPAWQQRSDSLFQASRYRLAVAMLDRIKPVGADARIAWRLEQGRHRTYLADYEAAIAHLREAERLALASPAGERHPLLPAIYDRQGEWHRWRYFDSYRAICLSNRALQLRRDFHPNDSLGLAQTYYQLGRAYQDLQMKRATGAEDDNQRIAQAFYEAAMEIPQLLEEDPDTYGWCMNRIAVCGHYTLTRGRQPKAENWGDAFQPLFAQLAQTDSFFQAHFERPHFGLSQVWHNYGNFYSDRAAYYYLLHPETLHPDLNRSNQYLEWSLHARQELFGSNHPMIALMFYLLGHNQAVLQNHEPSLVYFEQANKTLLPDIAFNYALGLPLKLPDYIDAPNYLLYSLSSMGHRYRILAMTAPTEETKQVYLRACLHTWLLAQKTAIYILKHRKSMYLDEMVSDLQAAAQIQVIQDIGKLRSMGEVIPLGDIFQTMLEGQSYSLKTGQEHPAVKPLYGRLITVLSHLDSLRLTSVTDYSPVHKILMVQSFFLSQQVDEANQSLEPAPTISLPTLQATLAKEDAKLLMVSYFGAGRIPDGDTVQVIAWGITPDTMAFGGDTHPVRATDSLLHYLHHPNPTDPAVFAGFCHWSHEVYKLI